MGLCSEDRRCRFCHCGHETCQAGVTQILCITWASTLNAAVEPDNGNDSNARPLARLFRIVTPVLACLGAPLLVGRCALFQQNSRQGTLTVLAGINN